MSTNTSIEWATKSWSPIIGCDRVSSGCDHCYAINTAHIRSHHPNPKIANAFAGTTERRDGRIDWTGKVNLLPERLIDPLKWRKPERVFVNSQSDLFHDQVPDDFIAEVFAVMACNYQWDRSTHTFQLLTKRHARMRSLLSSDAFRRNVASVAAGMTDDGHSDLVYDNILFHHWPLPNVHVGVSAENAQWAKIRGDALRETPAAVRWISCEPLLGPIDDLDLTGIGWVVVGGESGREDRPMHVDWARSLRDQCATAGVAFLFKQWGETVPLGQMTDEARRRWDDKHGSDAYPDESLWRIGKKAAGRELDGHEWNGYPEVSGV